MCKPEREIGPANVTEGYEREREREKGIGREREEKMKRET